jgi:glycosyltransferase involved in cell wall biosynthesis
MYAMSDLYVMPSVSEPFGLTPFEALLYDIPIIISKNAGVGEILKNAVFVDFWDIHKMADTIIMILTNDAFAQTIVERCKDDIEHIGWHIAAKKINVIYERLL